MASRRNTRAMNPTAQIYDAAMALAQNNTQTLAVTNANNIPTIEESLPHDRSFADREPDELDIENEIKLDSELLKEVNQLTFIELMQMVKNNDETVFVKKMT